MQIKKALQSFSFIAIVTVVLLEVGARLLPEKKPKILFDMAQAPEWQASPWAIEWQQEHDKLRRTFRAYEIYGLDPFSGHLISIGDDGFRNSDLGSNVSEASFPIGIFGGSTMWGSFARDAHTVSSELNRVMAGQNVRVENYAQVGFVFTQEFHEAQRLVYSNRPNRKPLPKMMVFIDGVNDAMATLSNFTQGVRDPAGLPWEYAKYRYLFQLGRTGEVSFLDILKKSKFVRLVCKILEQKRVIEGDEKGTWLEPAEEDKNRLAKETAQIYLSTVRAAQLSLTSQGIKPVFVLQPILFHKKFPTKSEADLIEKNKHWQPFLMAAFENIVGGVKDLPDGTVFVDLSRLFSEERDLRFYDVLHYTEAANAAVATALAPSLKF